MRDHIHDKTDQQNNYTFNKKNKILNQLHQTVVY